VIHHISAQLLKQSEVTQPILIGDDEKHIRTLLDKSWQKQEHPDLIILEARQAKDGPSVTALSSLSETRESQFIVLTESTMAEINTIMGTILNNERKNAKKVTE
jgi:hypothetical protein